MINIRFSQKKEERSGIFYDINKKISDFISNKIEKKINLIEDNNSIEIVASDLNKVDSGEIKVELSYRKTITINNSDLFDKSKVDKLIMEIKNFCEQAINIEKFSYVPIHMREKKETKKDAD
jgi:hypothetical protein